MAMTFEKDEQLRQYITIRSHYLLPMMAITAAAVFAATMWLIWDTKALYPIKSHLLYLLQVAQGHKPWSVYSHYLMNHGMVTPIAWRLSFATLLAGSASILVGWHWFARPDRLKGLFVIDGVQVYDQPKTALKALKSNANRGDKKGISIYNGDGGSYRLPFELETKHILYLGSVGTGKTATMRHAIQSMLNRGDAAIIYDYKGDFTEWLAGMDGIHMIAFADSRSEQWHIAKDINSPLLARELAQTVIQETNDPIWSNNARDVLAGTIEYLIKTKPMAWGFSDLSALLSGDSKALAGKLNTIQHGAANLIDKSTGDKTASSIMSTLRSGAWIFDTLADVWGNPTDGFSIRHWLQQGQGIYILRNYPAYSAVSNWLLGIIFNQTFGEALSLNDDSNRRIWAVIDELATLPAIPRLQECLVASRSKGFRFICGIQNFSSMRETYGQNIAQTLFSQFATKIICRVSDADTAGILAASMGGMRKIKRAEVKRVKDIDGNGDSIYRWQADWRDLQEQTMLDSDIMNLPDPTKVNKVVAWLSISGMPIAKLRWKFLPSVTTAKRDVLVDVKCHPAPDIELPDYPDDLDDIDDIDIADIDELEQC